MNRIYVLSNWTFGVLFLLVGLITLLSEKVFPALPLLAISLLLLPPVRNFAYTKTNKALSSTARIAGVALLISVFVVAVTVTHGGKKQDLPGATPEQIEAQKAEQEKLRIAKARQDKIDAHFSKWDGAHRGVEKAIKEAMHNPSSYEHAETRYIDHGDHLTILTTFRGTNAFGGVVTNRAKAQVDLDGKVLSLDMGN